MGWTANIIRQAIMHNKAWPPIMQDRLALALGPNTRLSKQMLAVARALTTSWEMLLWMTQSEAPSREEKRREEKRREEEKNREQKNNKKKAFTFSSLWAPHSPSKPQSP